jgi:hypothetical protein
VCLFVGTVPDILGLVWPRVRPKFAAGSLTVFGALLAQPRSCAQQEAHSQGIVAEEAMQDAFKVAIAMKSRCRMAIGAEYVLDQLFKHTQETPAAVRTPAECTVAFGCLAPVFLFYIRGGGGWAAALLSLGEAPGLTRPGPWSLRSTRGPRGPGHET